MRASLIERARYREPSLKLRSHAQLPHCKMTFYVVHVPIMWVTAARREKCSQILLNEFIAMESPLTKSDRLK